MPRKASSPGASRENPLVSEASAASRPADPPSADWDRALPFQLDTLGVRGRLVRLGPSLDAIIERHGYPLAVARPLAEALVLAATLASSLKYEGIFTLQLSGNGPIRLLVTDVTSDGAVRGYAQHDPAALAALSNREIIERAGSQGVELMTWITMRGALNGDVRKVTSLYHAPISNTGGAVMLLSNGSQSVSLAAE